MKHILYLYFLFEGKMNNRFLNVLFKYNINAISSKGVHRTFYYYFPVMPKEFWLTLPNSKIIFTYPKYYSFLKQFWPISCLKEFWLTQPNLKAILFNSSHNQRNSDQLFQLPKELLLTPQTNWPILPKLQRASHPLTSATEGISITSIWKNYNQSHPLPRQETHPTCCKTHFDSTPPTCSWSNSDYSNLFLPIPIPRRIIISNPVWCQRKINLSFLPINCSIGNTDWSYPLQKKYCLIPKP